MKNTREITENTEKGLQAIPADPWPLHGVRGLQVSQLFPVVVVVVVVVAWRLELTQKAP